MFTGRTTQQRSSRYVRRSSQYFSANHFIDYRSQSRPSIAVPTSQTPVSTVQQEESELPTASTSKKTSLVLKLRNARSYIRTRIPNRQIALLYGMATVVFVAGLIVSVSGAQTNRAVAAQVTRLQKQATAVASSSTSAATVVVPSAAKPSAAAVAKYTVTPNDPRYIDIPALGVHAEVLPEGVSSSNQLQVPWDIYETGWYNASAQPGQPGAMLIDGHSGIDGMHGVFYQLSSLVNGDQITVTRGDGQKFTYTVVKVQVVNVKNIDMHSMVVSADQNEPGLNLITCTGDQIPGTEELNERVQVYAVMQ